MQADPLLSPHFHLSEFTHSQTAARQGIPNEPTPVQVANLTRLAALLEDVRAALGGVPMLISSGFRSPVLNQAVRGAGFPPSAHLDGRAADFTAPSFGTPREICERLIDLHIAFDQLICEGTWVHFGIESRSALPRNRVLTAHFMADGRTTYTTGLD